MPRVRAYNAQKDDDALFVLYNSTGAIVEHGRHDVVILKSIRCAVDNKEKPFVEGELITPDVRFCFNHPMRVRREDGVWRIGFKQALLDPKTGRFYWVDPATARTTPLFVADLGVLCSAGLFVMF